MNFPASLDKRESETAEQLRGRASIRIKIAIDENQLHYGVVIPATPAVPESTYLGIFDSKAQPSSRAQAGYLAAS